MWYCETFLRLKTSVRVFNCLFFPLKWLIFLRKRQPFHLNKLQDFICDNVYPILEALEMLISDGAWKAQYPARESSAVNTPQVTPVH